MLTVKATPSPHPGVGGSGEEVQVVSFQTDFYSDILFGFSFLKTKHVFHMIVHLGLHSATFWGVSAQSGPTRRGSRGGRGVSAGVLGGQARKEEWQEEALWGDSLDNTSAHAGPRLPPPWAGS